MMLGKSHIVVGSVLGVGTVGYLRAVAKLTSWTLPSRLSFLQDLTNKAVVGLRDGSSWILDWIFPDGFVIWWVIVGAILFLIGSLFPDIDNPSSMLGRYLPIPLGPHRGITHTDWVVIGFLAISTLPIPGFRLLFFFTYGYGIHLMLDGWSTAGRARFWPLGSYKYIERGGTRIVVTKKVRFLHYNVGSVSEYLFAIFFILLGGLGIYLGFFT